MTDLPVHHFEGRDGVRLAYRELGTGRPLVLLHGLFSTAMVNWVRFGHAERLAAAGHRVVMPDLRGHGDSGRPHDPSAFPPDVLADDALALLAHLGLDGRGAPYDLGGYSLGGRTVIRALARGARPARAVVAGMGLDGIVDPTVGTSFFRRVLTHPGTFERGSREWMAEAFLESTGGDREALLLVLDASVATPVEEVAAMEVPTLVLVGADDAEHASASALAELLPHATFRVVPGTHMSAVSRPDLGVALVGWLEGTDPSGAVPPHR